MSDRDREDVERGCLTLPTFVSAMQYLSSRYRFVRPADCIKGSFSDQVILTFDDGYADVFQNAWPVLRAMGIPFTVCLTAGFVGADGMLTKEQVIQMASDPLVTWGAHGLMHRELDVLRDDELQQEVTGSKHAVERMTCKQVEVFSYPNGKFNDHVKAVVAKSGMQLALATGRTMNPRPFDYLALKRIPFEEEPLARFAFRVAAGR